MCVPTRDYWYTHPGKGNTSIMNVLCVPTIYTIAVHTVCVPTRDYGYTHPGKGNTSIMNVLCVPTMYTLWVHTPIDLNFAHKFIGSVYYRLTQAVPMT